MIKVIIDYYDSLRLFSENEEAYNKLHNISEKFFISKPSFKFFKDENGKISSQGYDGFVFYINDLNNIVPSIIKHCRFETIDMLEMMGGARINTENIVEAISRNQIMLPNNLMLEMKELMVSTNACTNEINECLKQGWKLIAILPQHNQPRPDYILGRI